MRLNSVPKVSIITITYNAGEFLEKTIQSVISQNYQNIEYIIIDGLSTDNTMEIVEKYSDHIDIIISEKDKGIYDAMNKALANATGEWVNFLNANDTFYAEDTLSNIFNTLSSDKKLLYGDWINVRNNGFRRHINSMPELNMSTLKSKFQMNHQSLFVKNEQLPFYDLTYKIKADYQWVIDIVKNLKGNEVKYINRPLVNYDVDGVSGQQLINNVKEYIYLTNRNFGSLQVAKNSFIYMKILRYLFIK